MIKMIMLMIRIGKLSQHCTVKLVYKKEVITLVDIISIGLCMADRSHCVSVQQYAIRKDKTIGGHTTSGNPLSVLIL